MKFIAEISQRFSRRTGKPVSSYTSTIQEITDFIEGDFVERLKKFNMACDRKKYHMVETPEILFMR